MIDHVGFAVADSARSRQFYEQALAPLGITLIMSVAPEQTESGGLRMVSDRTESPTSGSAITSGPARAPTLPSRRRPALMSTPSIGRLWPPVAPTMARPASGRTIIPTITARSFTTLTAST